MKKKTNTIIFIVLVFVIIYFALGSWLFHNRSELLIQETGYNVLEVQPCGWFFMPVIIVNEFIRVNFFTSNYSEIEDEYLHLDKEVLIEKNH